MDDPSCLPQPAQGKHQNASSASAIGVQSVRPTWFEDFAVPKGAAPQTDQGQPQPLHGLKLVIKEEALPLKEQPEFPALQRRPAHAKPDFN